MEKPTKNIGDLTDRLLEDFDNVRSGKLSLKACKEHANLAGKIIRGATAKLEYNKYMNITTPIKYLEDAHEGN